MNINTLKAFCLVVEVGSISQAAKLSYVSQPAVTKQIHQLESTYEVLLFDRKDGRLVLTESGKVLYPYAKTIVEDFRRSQEAVLDNSKGYHETLTVGASLTIGEYLLPGLLGQYNRNHPDINFSLMVENTPRVLEALVEGVIDVALVEGIVKDKKLLVENMADDELILIHAPDHPWKQRNEIDIEEIAHERMLWREPTSGTRLIIEDFLRQYGVFDKINQYMDLGSTQSIKSAVEAGLGISIVSRLTVAREINQGVLCEAKIKGISFKRDLWLVRKQQRFSKKSAQAFAEFILK
ncbi:LysR family transcriptional regulator [Radiobacillus sp. PE A8.2]|uniref:LysR family transcriptional regulator n=1 Tax=Radiobacillus sp. PE A8.2 TaxID=3380349 RepID=UPI00389096FB